MHTCMSELSKAQLTRSMKTNKTHLKTPFSSFFVFWRRKGVVEVIAICFQIVDIYVHFDVNFWTTFLDWPYFVITFLRTLPACSCTFYRTGPLHLAQHVHY